MGSPRQRRTQFRLLVFGSEAFSRSLCSRRFLFVALLHFFPLKDPVEIALEESSFCKGKEGLLIPEQTEVIDSSLLNLSPHRSEIQSIVLAEAGRWKGI
ncbi:hypothetical protein K1719_008434 [Acacia pycnantha]|nr:hypothetical protein K1719_008434 [Acacia pycnantha]